MFEVNNRNTRTRFNMFKVNNKDTRTTPLAFRIFDSIRHQFISSAFKNMCFGKGRRFSRKKLQKVQLETVKLNVTKSCILVDVVGVLALV